MWKGGVQAAHTDVWRRGNVKLQEQVKKKKKKKKREKHLDVFLQDRSDGAGSREKGRNGGVVLEVSTPLPSLMLYIVYVV